MITDNKITASDFEGKNIKSLPDNPSNAGVTATELKAFFDRGIEQVVADKFNALIDELTGIEGASNILSADGLNVQVHITVATNHIADTALHVPLSNLLTKDNVEPYTPQGQYAPATKDYVDQKQVTANSADMMQAVYDPNGKNQDLFAYVDQKTTSKVDKVTGFGLSQANFTTAEKQKLADIEAGAGISEQSDWNEQLPNSPKFIVNKPSIINNLTSGGINNILSAEMGKNLQGNKMDKTETYTKTEINTKFSNVPSNAVKTTFNKGVVIGGYASAGNGSGEVRNIYIGTMAPSGGMPGDLWVKV